MASERRVCNLLHTRILFAALLAICLFIRPAEADDGGEPTVSAQTSTYQFLADKSTITQTGGIAGIHRTYTIIGTFHLTADFEAGTASFDRVDANAVDDSPDRHTIDPNEVFNMTELAGVIIDGTTIRFEGTADDGSSVLVTLTFADDTAALKGQTTPPPNSADFFVFALDAVAQRKYSGGTGEPNDPYQIATAADLITLGETPEDYDKHFILTADIDLDPKLPGRAYFRESVIASRWSPEFRGNFNGQYYRILNMNIVRGGYLGLFGQLASGAVVSHLGLENIKIAGTDSNIGGLVGINRGTVLYSYCTGSISGGGNGILGGLIGENSGGSISDCYSTCAVVEGGRYVGGLVGWNHEGSVNRCHSTGVVSGFDDVGGLVGDNWDSVLNSHSTGRTKGRGQIGGLIGNNSGWVLICYSTGAVSATGKDVGGLVGSNRGTVSNSNSESAVSGTENVGGLVGSNDEIVSNSYSTGTVVATGEHSGGLIGVSTGTVSNSYSTDRVSGADYAGGLVGITHGLVSNSYSTGDVTGAMYVGGLVGSGLAAATVTNCHSIGSVSGKKYVGGLMGSGFASNSFWNVDVFKQSTTGGGRGISPVEMQDPNTFRNAGWDFLGESENGTCEIWQIPPGGQYPMLAMSNGYAPSEPKGDGSAESPYLVETARDLGAIWYRPTAHYRLVSNIQLFGARWSTAVVPSFTGTLNGQDYRIVGLTVSGTGYLGLIARLTGEVKDLGVVDINVTGSGDFIGGLVASNQGDVNDCYTTGQVSGNSDVGGLVGSNDGLVTWCNSRTDVNGIGQWPVNIGGLVGFNNEGEVTRCYSEGPINTGSHLGGLVGLNWGTISMCYATGAVRGSGQDMDVGGLVGVNASGFNKGGGVATYCYSTGAVDGNYEVGGLVGTNWGATTNCYSSGKVTGLVDVFAIGGLVGSNIGSVVTSYSVGGVVADGNDVGGLVGSSTSGESLSGTAVSSFWDIDSSGQKTSAGGAPRTMAEMKAEKTFTDDGWDFVGETINGTDDIWWILEGQDYPRLWWEAE